MALQVMIPSLTTYDRVRDVDYIITEMEQGIFINSAMLVDQILRNSRVFSTVMTRIVGLLGKVRDIDPASEIDGRTKSTAVRVAEDVERDWSKLFPHAALVELMTWGILHNSGLAQVTQDGDTWSLDVWHPWALRWDPVDRVYSVQTRDQQFLTLLPDGKGGYVSEDGARWILFTPHGYGNMRRGLVRVLAHLYLELEWAHRDRARYSEVHGQPLRVGVAPAQATDDECEAFENRLSPLGAEPVVVVRQGIAGAKWDAKLVEAMGTSQTLFENEIEQLHKEVATLLLGQSQTTDGQAGLGANELAGEPIRLDIMKSDDAALTDCLGAQFLRPYCEFTYGNADLAPHVCYHVDPPEDRAKKALEMKTIIDGLVAAKAAQLPIDVREVLEDYSIPAMSEAEEAAMKADAAAKMAAQPAPAAPLNGAAQPSNGAAKPMPMMPAQ